MLGFDRGDGYDDCRCHSACYGLLEGGVHSLRVSYDFLETGNYFKKLVWVYELRRVVKMRGSESRCFCFSSRDVKKRWIYWLGNSHVVDEFL